MRRTPLTVVQRNGDINLTPLMDLTFILLITFIITFPLIEQGIPVRLPKGKTQELSPEQAQTITIDEAGMLHLNQAPIALEQLAAQMKQLALSQPDIVVMVRADERIQYRSVVEVLRVLSEAKITRMALVTDPAKQKT